MLHRRNIASAPEDKEPQSEFFRLSLVSMVNKGNINTQREYLRKI